MSVGNGKVCCNCRHCIRSRDDKYDMIICRCDKNDIYLSYADIMVGWCKAWARARIKEDE